MKWILFSVTIMFTPGLHVETGSYKAPLNRKEVVCFIYHRFGDSRYPSTNVSVADFETHLEYLLKNDFQLLTFSAAISYLNSSAPQKKTAVITIDDGYKSFYRNALPLLKKFNVPATLFINTETVGGDYMTWEELNDVVKHNIEIGNHTHSHKYFLDLPAESRYTIFKEEIELSQSIIKKKLSIDPKVFSFPYGELDIKMKNIVKQAGFVAAAAQNSGVLSQESDLFQCPRFPMSEAYSSKEQFAEKLSMHSLQILSESPEGFTLESENPPTLTLSFAVGDLDLKQLQCFVQGGECEVQTLETNSNSATLKVHARKPLTRRRRTLYTITVPDKKGRWHWYSHLWINPDVHQKGY